MPSTKPFFCSWQLVIEFFKLGKVRCVVPALPSHCAITNFCHLKVNFIRSAFIILTIKLKYIKICQMRLELRLWKVKRHKTAGTLAKCCNPSCKVLLLGWKIPLSGWVWPQPWRMVTTSRWSYLTATLLGRWDHAWRMQAWGAALHWNVERKVAVLIPTNDEVFWRFFASKSCDNYEIEFHVPTQPL